MLPRRRLTGRRSSPRARTVAELWPWLAIAGGGALHGLNPANGWIWAAAWGLRSGGRARALRALLPIAVGHTASIAVVAGAVAFGATLDRGLLQFGAATLCVLAVALHLSRRTAQAARAPAGHAGLALWSFMMATAHGAGLMLVPALIPLCMLDAAAPSIGAAGPLSLALAAVGLHSAAMLLVTGLVAGVACRGAGWFGTVRPHLPSLPARRGRRGHGPARDRAP